MGIYVISGLLPAAVVASLWRLCIGYCISLAIGVPLGLLLGRLQLLDDMALVMASMLIIIVIGLIADTLIPGPASGSCTSGEVWVELSKNLQRIRN